MKILKLKNGDENVPFYEHCNYYSFHYVNLILHLVTVNMFF